ncbi:MAG: peptidyl-prolyl cis-trans isomerase [Proteobacteria bacterium]|nr:peptidyl-prolyl cis-trans isomerase [Pseudomonadota bacterium]
MTRGHTFSGVFLCLVISTGIWLSYTVSVSAFSILEMLGIGTDETEETVKPTGQKQDKPSAEKPKADKKATKSSKKLKAELELSDLQKTLSVLDANQRKSVLADEKVFRAFVEKEADNVSVLIAARSNKVDQSEKTLILAQRGVDNIVRELYLNQLLTSKIPADFPTDKQVQEYYDKNKDNFVIEERVHTWQIFLPIKEDMSVKDIELLKKKAESITNNLKKKKTDFVSAANKHSKHEASRLSGGYMGLIKISEFKPEIKAAIKTLKQGDISKPIKTDDGIHILKRGAIVPKQDITLEQVKPKITELMLKQLRIQIRQAVFKQASITYPVDLNDKNMEEWRLKLRTN